MRSFITSVVSSVPAAERIPGLTSQSQHHIDNIGFWVRLCVAKIRLAQLLRRQEAACLLRTQDTDSVSHRPPWLAFGIRELLWLNFNSERVASWKMAGTKSQLDEINGGGTYNGHPASLMHQQQIPGHRLKVYVLENKGRVPDGTVLNLNIQCVLSTHPRLGLKHCVFSHVLDGGIHPAKLLQRRCDTELIILIPVLPPDDPTSPNYYEWLPEYAFQAILILRNGHNHPAHPHIKPSAEDERLLGAAMDALGTENLTVQTLLNGKPALNPGSAQSTQAMYDGKRVSAVSPAFADIRKIRDRIAVHRKVEFPAGTGFSGTSSTLLFQW
ncbi:hypothetical protein B0H14DRAFT_2656320 [Mycena olivaceomarginata]|nr:hypothetical protein B0H14DRAFT_2656320 [Mycena olivaceomarginata]